MKREQLKRLIKLLLLSILKRIAAAQGGAQAQAAPAAPVENAPRQEVSTTGGVAAFQTPKAFDKKKVKSAKKRCPDCGAVGQSAGHMGCQYPQDHD